jgi:hypothetical protein
MRVTSESPENEFHYCNRYRWVTGLYCLNGASVFIGRNNVFLTPQLGQERCMRFVRATGVSHGLYDNVSEFLLSCVVLRSSVAHGMKFKFGKNCLGANVLIPALIQNVL